MANHMDNGLFLLHRAYHFFVLACSSTRFLNRDSASIFLSSTFSFSSSLSHLASARSISPYLRFQRWDVAWEILCLRQTESIVSSISACRKHTDDLFGTVLFLFHEPTPYPLRNSLAFSGANQGCHAIPTALIIE
jgi:hypothetical protein